MIRRLLTLLALLCASSIASAALIPVLQCAGPGTGGDRADLRGIQFTADKGFSALNLSLRGGTPGNYSFTVELRRSNGFIVAPEKTAAAAFVSVGSSGTHPYQVVPVNLGPVAVAGATNFTVKLTNIVGPDVLFIEQFGIGNQPCPNVVETDENNVANPTPRSDPAGFAVLKTETEYASGYTSTPPRIDGVIDVGEWNLSNSIPLGTRGYAVLQNDGMRLYVLLNLTGDAGNDPGVGDYFYLTFDVDKDGFITPDVDKNYSLVPANGNLRYQLYLGPNVWTGLQPDTFSARAQGYGCFFADGSLSLTGFPFRITCSSHRVWELAIDLAELNSNAGSFTRMGVRVSSDNPNFTDNFPSDLTSRFTDLTRVNLGSSGLFSLLCPGSVALDNPNAIELTQAIQTRTNALSLVADKATVARVYVDANSVICGSLPSKVNLYGRKGAVDLPGSPLAKIHSAPATINRETLAGTANFALPSTWDDGTVTYKATARFGAGTSTSPDLTHSYTPKTVPTYWVVPINRGTAGSPVLISNAEIESQKSYLRTIFPIKSVNFVHKPWQDLGPVAGEPITALNTYYNNNLIAWILGVIFTGTPPFTLPNQVYGFTPSGGGLSDPVWIGSIGVSARGFRGTSLEGTYAHEVNHNLDGSNNGTWGRHVNPNGTGCGAGGPDPNWPYANSNIQEVGFDTRQPWNAGPATRTVIPANTPDIMSYCQSGFLPTKWIAPYRWTNLFNDFSNAAADVADLKVAAATVAPQLTFYIVGAIDERGTGRFSPILTQPGFPMEAGKEGRYAIQLLGAAGALYEHRFNVSFEEEEGEKQTRVPFNFMLPAVPGTQRIRLLGPDGGLLDEIIVSKSLPTVQVLAPKKGDQWKETARIQWEAGDQDGDALTFNILISGDGGKTWRHVADSVRGSFYDLLISSLALGGTDSAIVRVIATDGVNTASDDSDPFSILPSPPEVQITQPGTGDQFVEGAQIAFQGGCAQNVCTDENLVWSYSVGGGPFVNFGAGPATEGSLPAGTLTVRLTGVNSDGLPGTADIAIQVQRDTDRDGIPDRRDNCTEVPNDDQRDSNQDGIGNVCDADLNNDNIVNALDLGVFKTRFGTRDPDADFNGDGIVNSLDLGILKELFGKRPGPSGLPR